MLIEFTGCTGSGKTTVVERVREKLSHFGIEAYSSVEFTTGLIGLKTINNPTIQNIILDILVFPRVILSLKKNFKFYSFALRLLLRKPDSFIGALNRFRSIIRKIGVNELLRSKENCVPIIIIDEGTVHSVHNIFVYSSFPIDCDDIKTFSQLVPLPDVVVLVEAPKDIILKHTLTRRDPPVRFEPKGWMNKYIDRALMVFKKLSSMDRIKDKLFTINLHDDANFEEINSYTEQIVNLVLETQDSSKN